MKRIITLFFLTVTASSAFAKEIPEYCLENDAAHAYMTEVTYPDDDYTFTKITDYCDPEPWRWYKYDGYRKDQPKPVPLTWEAAADAESLLLKVYCFDHDHLMKILIDTIQNIPGIGRTETLVSLDQAIERQVWVKDYDYHKSKKKKKA